MQLDVARLHEMWFAYLISYEKMSEEGEKRRKL